MTQMQDDVLKVGDSVAGHEIVISSASKTNRIRDAGLFAIALGLGVMVFLWMNTENKQKIALEELAKESKEAIDKANKNMTALQEELERVKKGAIAAEAVKQDLSKEFKSTREMLFKAWQHHAKELELIRKTVERIDKDRKTKEQQP
jgi:uncharacterized protein HemX